MAKLRKFVAYRRLDRPYTRHSKYNKKSFVRAKPVCRVVRFDMGDQNKDYFYELELRSKQALQIRDNAIEAARQAAVRGLERPIGKKGFFLRIRVYPHHILRENPLASGAGADRMSTGMKKSFGKAIGRAAQIRKGQIILQARVEKQHLAHAKKAFKTASHKLPMGYQIVVKEIKK